MGFVVTLEGGYTRVWSTPSSFITFIDKRIDTDSHISLGSEVINLEYTSRTVNVSWKEQELRDHGITTIDDLYDWMVGPNYDWSK